MNYKILTFDEMVALHSLGVRGFEYYDYKQEWISSGHNRKEDTKKVISCRRGDEHTVYRVPVEE